MKSIIRQFVAATLALSFAAAGAQSLAPRFPVKTVRLIVPFPGGGALDAVARTLAEHMSPVLGQRIVVEPMPGAGTVVATQYVMRQPADGYTMVLITSSAAIRSAGLKPPFDIRKDLALVGKVAGSKLILAVNQEVPAKSMRELIDYARANPGKLNISSYGNGTLSHLTAELLMLLTGAKMVHVPYAGSAANALALAQGTTQVTIDSFTAMRPHQERGSIRFLAVTAGSRSSEAPELPTVSETRVAAIDLESWSGLAVPAGTPPEVVEALSKALNAALKEPALIAFFRRAGIGEIAESPTPRAFTSLVNQDMEVFSKLIRDAKLDVD